ncbi:hypothetical protein CKO25_13880 [Thiocapsa imhoffii]|uniref:histidine kinase n=1 Tax=Thiocapsa imhoffii TaxID=382777 RepID=A0A9X0WJ82_9GAMM|nr:ATP-binding protein [Thiocapsa imhoffii]MBK1645719.1 hypothetical protein [Thiocapsa imhoffii]
MTRTTRADAHGLKRWWTRPPRFATRLALYFGTLFALTLGTLFALWYLGLPQLGLEGVRHRWLQETSRLLEYGADQRLLTLLRALEERRSDILFNTESRTLARQLRADDPAVQESLETLYERLQRAYPGRYERFLILHPQTGQILASHDPAERGQVFEDFGLIERVRQSGHAELIAERPFPDGTSGLVIIRQFFGERLDDDPATQPIGIAVAFLNVALLFEGYSRPAVVSPLLGTRVCVFDSQGRVIRGLRGETDPHTGIRLRDSFGCGDAETLARWVAVEQGAVSYRAVALGDGQVWTLASALSQSEALERLEVGVGPLIMVGLFLTMLGLLLITLAARRLTHPLRALTAAVGQLGHGHFETRVQSVRGETRELRTLAHAFNRMAGEIQANQQSLTQLVAERTADLRATQARLEASMAQLTRSEALYRALFEQAPLGILLADATTGRIIEVNDRCAEIVGRARGDLEQLEWMELADPDELPSIQQALEELNRGSRVSFHGEQRYAHPDGSLHWFDLWVAPINLNEARTCQLAFMQDCTERVAGANRIRETLYHLRLATDAAEIGVWTWDLESGVITADARVCRWFEVSADQCRAGVDVAFWRSRVHPDDLDEAATKLERAIATGTSFEHSYRLSLPSGRERTIHAVSFIEPESAKGPARMLGIHQDVTVQHRAEAQLRAETQAAEAASRAKSQFLAHMSHEIRTPLNAILGLVQVLEHSVHDPDQVEILRQISDAGRSLRSILDDILDLSKIEAEQLHLDSRPFRLETLLATIETLQGAVARAKGLVFVITAPEMFEGALRGDPLRLQQILNNLLDNAIKFTDRGEVRLEVTPLDVRDEQVRLRFEISDTGTGISPAALPNLFMPFTQADTGISRRFGGTGLGLSISKRLVELLGGELSVRSQVGAGSTFRLEMSFARTQERVAATLTTPAARGARLAGLHCLVVDDSAINLDVLERMLALEGARATRASDGEQALVCLRAAPMAFDAVLMDVQMPVLDGLSATRAIRGELGLTRLPILAVTAGVLKDEQQRARAAGIDDLLPKPIEFEQLVATLIRLTTRPPADPSMPPPRLSVPAVPAFAEPYPQEEMLAGIDPARAALFGGTGQARFREVLRVFLSETERNLTELRAACAQGARDEATALLHRLRGAAANLGAYELVEPARQLEERMRGSQPDAPEPRELWLGQLDAALARLRDTAASWQPEPPSSDGPDQEPITPERVAEPLDRSRLADLRMALESQRPRPAREAFHALRASLTQTYGPERIRIIAAAIDELRFAAALAALDALTGED